MKTSPIGKKRRCYGNNTNNHKKLLMPQSYGGCHQKGWGGAMAATDKISECHMRKLLNLQVFLQISTTRNAWKLLPRYSSVFLIRHTLTHNNTLQVRCQFFGLQTLVLLMHTNSFRQAQLGVRFLQNSTFYFVLRCVFVGYNVTLLKLTFILLCASFPFPLEAAASVASMVATPLEMYMYH